MPDTNKFHMPSVATDICIFTLKNNELQVVLIERKKDEPFGWAIPGGFLIENEELDRCAERTLKGKTGISSKRLFHFGNYSKPNRDPRKLDGHPLRVISIAYLALVPENKLKLNVGLESKDANLIPVTSLPKKLAFSDHQKIIHEGWASLKDRVVHKHWLLDIMPKEFTIAELHEAYKAIGVYEADGENEPIGGIANKNRGNFHKYVDKNLIKKDFIMDIGKTRKGAMGPPNKIYTKC